MNMIRRFIKIIRPLNCFITFLTIVVGGLICSSKNDLTLKIILAGLVGFFVAASGNIINDYYDIEIDRTNRPSRPLSSGVLSKNNAIIFFFILVIISLTLSSFITLYVFAISAIAVVLLFLYSFKLKSMVLVGNIAVSLLTALAFVFAGVAVESLVPAIIPAVFAFLINLIREVVKDIEDKEGDSLFGMRTLPIEYGDKRAKIFVIIISGLLFLFTFIPFLFQIYKIEYFLVVMVIVNPILFYSMRLLFYDSSKRSLSRISSLLKLDMVVGLIAIYLGR